MKVRTSKRKIPWVFRIKWMVLFLVLIFSLISSYYFLISKVSPAPLAAESYPELEYIKNHSWSFDSFSKYLDELANKKDAVYAYEILKQASIKENLDFHLLGHVVGDILYRQKGVEGMKDCTDDFRNACSHSIAVGFFQEKGEGGIGEISKVCEKAPGGKGAYKMCFHGLGHGVLAFTNYEVPKAMDLCQKIPANNMNGPEAIGCIGGVVMEIVGGGFHSKELWKVQSDYYLTKSKPLNICLGGIIPEFAKNECLVYLTPFLLGLNNAFNLNPSEDNLRKSFSICSQIPRDQSSLRNTCFGGFGKEFVVLAQNRDVRGVEYMTTPQLQKVYSWCSQAGEKDATGSCINYAVKSLYWSGENEPDAAINFCGLTEAYKKDCIEHLTLLVSQFAQNTQDKGNFCKKVPKEYAQDCQKKLGLTLK